VPARTAPVTAARRSWQGPPAPAPARPPRAFLDLGAVLTAPRCARAWTREILWEWEAAGLADAAELVASELVTNSLNACAGLDKAAIRLILTLDQGELAVLVRDDHPGAPMAAQPGADDEGGRGLLIVETLSDRCGWYLLENGKTAKVTWAVLSEADHAAGERPGRVNPGGPPDAVPAAGTQPARVLPARPRQVPPLTTGMRAPRLVDLEILARVKAALERL
jgi:anti-sigma regulatory factor (Ser/Thr protein kinase)